MPFARVSATCDNMGMAGPRKIAKDMYLFREGDPPDAMYLVKSGSLAITKTKGNSEVTLAEITVGSMVGEMAIFDKKPRSANVKALKDSEVIELPYEALEKQLEAVPTWIKAIMKTMNENLRDANKKIKILEHADNDQDRWPPHVINSMLTLINLVGAQFGQKEPDGSIVIPSTKLRNYTIQIFQLPTNKMDAVQIALQELKLFKVEDIGEGRKKLTNLNPAFLMDFVDWYNEWLYKQEKDRVTLSAEEVKTLTAVIHFAKKAPEGPKKERVLNLADMQNESMKELGFVLKLDDVNPLIEKKLMSDKMMGETGTTTNVFLEDIEKPAAFWKLVWDLRRLLH